MELTGDILIGAPRDKVWAGLNDPDVLARCIPGCEGVEATSPTEKTARVMVKVGPVRARFVGRCPLIQPSIPSPAQAAPILRGFDLGWLLPGVRN